MSQLSYIFTFPGTDVTKLFFGVIYIFELLNVGIFCSSPMFESCVMAPFKELKSWLQYGMLRGATRLGIMTFGKTTASITFK